MADSPDIARLADRMVRWQLRARGIHDPKVLDAMRRVPRHRFVQNVTPEVAYSDHALPCGFGQTISQPYIVAWMTQRLAVKPGQRVLEIGTGTGYQTAVLLELGAHVESIERIPELAVTARQRLAALYPTSRFRVHIGDGSAGRPNDTPYDRCLVAATAPDAPPALLHQLGADGRLILPVSSGTGHVLRVYTREPNTTEWVWRDELPCRFVPLIGKHGYDPAVHHR